VYMCGTSHPWPCSTSGSAGANAKDSHGRRASLPAMQCICVEQAIPGLVPPVATLYGQDGNPAVQTIRGRNPETLHAQSALVDPGGRDPADGSFDHLCPTIRTSEAAGRRVAKNKAPSAASGSPRPVTQARINCSAGNTMLGATHPGGVSAPPPVATAGAPISDAAIPAAVASL